jgi:hypothetical protein
MTTKLRQRALVKVPHGATRGAVPAGREKLSQALFLRRGIMDEEEKTLALEMWDDLVEQAIGYHWYPCYTPEKVLDNYRDIIRELVVTRKRLKNPVSLKGGAPLKPDSVRQLESKKRCLLGRAKGYRRFIKQLVKYNLLPTSKYISGKSRMQFVFSLWTMLEIPELGKITRYANRLINARYRYYPSTEKDYYKWLSEPGRMQLAKEECCRETMYDVLINSLEEAIQSIKKKRERFVFSGYPYPYKPEKKYTGKVINISDYQVGAYD